MRTWLSLVLAATTVAWLHSTAAVASPAIYTFNGFGGWSIDGAAQTPGDFVFTFYGDTSNIDTSAAPFFYLRNVGGTFFDGTTTYALAATATIVASASPADQRINFFNATFDNGLGLTDPTLVGYDLSVSFGPVSQTDPNLTPTFNGVGHGFATTDSHTIEMTSDRSLTFTAVVPEPATLGLMASGAGVLTLLRRRRQRAR